MVITQNFLMQLFEVAVAQADPASRIPAVMQNDVLPWLEARVSLSQRVWIVGAGKAAASMAAATERALEGRYEVCGLVITRHGHGAPTRHVKVIQAGHPVPDEQGRQGAGALLEMLRGIPAHEPVIALISGGGSSLLSVPVNAITFDDLRAVNKALLDSGAPISEMNIVRKHLTQTLGGQLAMACGSAIFSLVLSDVPGDDPHVVASGPFIEDPSSFAMALAVVKRWSMQLPGAAMSYLEEGARGLHAETPKPSNPRWRSVQTTVMASNRLSLNAVADALKAQGLPVLSLGDALEGEAKEVAAVQAAMVREALSDNGTGGWPVPPFALISGGECTVTLPKGIVGARGGRNSEFLLSLIHHLHGFDNYAALAGDTDGIDGSQDNAGAYWLAGDAKRLGLTHADTRHALDRHDAFGFFQAADRLLHTGPTLTNVNDIRIIVVGVAGKMTN